MAQRTDHIQQILSGLPEKPGIYQFFTAENILIYVGKAKNLRRRVTSYFSKELFENGKTALMVRKIADIKYIITETELDALLLENNLIKKHQPRYNVLLKDDKTFPWIVIKSEPFPRLFYTRKVIKDGSSYYGPFASGKLMHTMIDMIRSLYKLRTCNLNLTPENIAAKKFKVCLEYHIKNCKGPCEALQSKNEYDEHMDEIKQILKGNINYVLNHLEAMMNEFATKYEYEKAHDVKEKIEILETFKSKSVIVSPTIHNVDVFAIVSDTSIAFVNFMKVINGAIMQAQTIELKKKLEETDAELISIAMAELRERFGSNAREVLVNVLPDVEVEGVEFIQPKIGDKKHLLDLSWKNARYTMKEKLEQYDKLNPEHRTDRLLTQMMHDLRLKVLPRHIECFDNSNFQGTNAVGAMSVFKNAKPAKKEYRNFNIKTVEGPDDFASMEEIIYRRYKRLLEEKQPLPDLIVIDGGKGQLSAAITSLNKLNLYGKIPVIGIAKKLEEIFYPEDSVPLYLDKKSETLHIIQHLRDEVHNLGITHHRNKRSKDFIKTELEEIKGIGHATSELLLRHFRSVKKISEATHDELVAIVGNAKAKVVRAYFVNATSGIA